MLWAMVSFSSRLQKKEIELESSSLRLDPWLLRIPWHSSLCVDHIWEVDIRPVYRECVRDAIFFRGDRLMLPFTYRLQDCVGLPCHELWRSMSHSPTNTRLLDGCCDARPLQALSVSCVDAPYWLLTLALIYGLSVKRSYTASLT
jgi:hypothetical protein